MVDTNTKQKRFEALVGAAALAFVVVASAFFYWRASTTYVPPITLYVDFAARDGLKIGADVRTAGVNAGQVMDVTSYELSSEETQGRHLFVRAHLALEASAAKDLPANSTFQITTEGALGEQYIEITPGTLAAPPIHDGQILKGMEAFNPSKVLSLGGEVFTDLSEIVDSAKPHIDAIKDNGTAAFDNVEALQAKAEALRDRLSPALDLVAEHGTVVSQQASAVGAALGTATEGDALGPLGEAFDEIGAKLTAAGPRVKKDFARLETGYRDLSGQWTDTVTTAEARYLDVEGSVRDIVTGWNDLVEQSSSARRTIGAIYSDREIADDVGRAVDDMTGHPWRCIWPWQMPRGSK